MIFTTKDTKGHEGALIKTTPKTFVFFVSFVVSELCPNS
jgi:hypothetical protein